MQEDRNPGAILDDDAILAQLVNGTAHRPPLVLYPPAVSFGYCKEIAMGLWIVVRLGRLCYD